MADHNQQQGVVLDALPYVETVHEDYEAYALTLVEEEMKKITPTELPELPPLKLSKLSQQHYNQIASGEETAKFQPYTVNPPADADDPEAWKKSVQEARAAYEAERLRRMVLELDADHGAHQWRHYTSSVLETLDTKLQQDHARQREQVDEINLQRQQHQQEAGRTIAILQNQWQDLVQKKYSLALATGELEAEVDVMRKRLPTEPELEPEAES